MSELAKLPRPDKLGVATESGNRLQERVDAGAPPEAALDELHSEIKSIIVKLSTHVDGVAAVQGARAALLVASDESDDSVDCWMRKIYGFLDAEALRRTGPNVGRAKALLAAAFPEGLAHIDDRIVDQNVHCHRSIEVLRAEENQAALTALEVPAGWIDKYDAAVKKSDADYEAVAKVRSDKSTHINLGRNAEEEWEDLMIRFRHYIAGRAKRHEVEKKEEGRMLLDPLLAAVKKMRADAETRATLRAKAKKEAAKAPAGEAKASGAEAKAPSAAAKAPEVQGEPPPTTPKEG